MKTLRLSLLLSLIMTHAFGQHGWGDRTANYPDDAPRIPSIELNERGGNLKVIPVVVHVIHNYGEENISDAQVQSAIVQLNEAFSAANVNPNEIASSFRDIIADTEIEFRLAKLDPEGNCTNGITRTVSPLTNSATNATKDVIGWPRNMYLNIWVVNSLESSFQVNYAYWPGTEPSAAYDGILYRHSNFGTIGTSSGNISPAYVAGVYLNLLPVWGSNYLTCGDDNVADTPFTIGSQPNSCDTTQVTCGTLDNVQNIMDYSTCGLMFTEGQKARMHSTLASSVSERDNLWTPANLLATGTNDGFSNSCAPIADYHANRTELCEGNEVDFTDFSWNAEITDWSWTFEGGTPATSTDQHPTVTYSTPGIYDVSFTVTSAGGTDTRMFQDYILVKPYGNAVLGTISEGFEQESFPVNSSPELNWSTPEPAGYKWERTTDAFTSGDASSVVDLGSIPYGLTIDMISPPLDFSWVTTDNATVSFDVAYAEDGGQSSGNEKLRVLVSYNCGESWIQRYNKQGSALSTNGGTTVNGNFVPTSSEWRTESVTLGPIAAQEPYVLIRFEATSHTGSKIYLDNINIANGALGIAVEENDNALSVYPNPVLENSVLELTSGASGMVMMEVYDVRGKLLWGESKAVSVGLNRIPLAEMVGKLPSGVYFLQVNGAELNSTIKLVRE
ncbi:MAG: T9SS type A sorting domain-containing protein [Flavobacteriales bacterium]|nr:T9SS type A sorting domain-containing protein [Flavobacteriales bacterium]